MVKYLNQICIQGKACSTPKTIRSNNCKEDYSFFIDVKRPNSDEVDRLKIIYSSEVCDNIDIVEDEWYRIEGRIGNGHVVATNIIKIPIEFQEKEWKENYITLNKSVVRGVVINKSQSRITKLGKRILKFKISTNDVIIACVVLDEDAIKANYEIKIGSVVNFEGRFESSNSNKGKYHVSVIKYYTVEL